MKRKISIFLHNPVAERACVVGMIRALSPKYSINIFTHDQVTKATFKNVGMIAFPGGKGDADHFDKIFKVTKDVIGEYVDRGGRYLGICMGAYWADKHYFNVLKDIECVQYIKRKTSEIKRSFPTTTIVNWSGEEQEMFFYDGPTFISSKNNFKTLAKYSNGDPMAIIQKKIGLIGCHPESEKSWYKPYIKDAWHEYTHHELLLQFVNKLYSK